MIDRRLRSILDPVLERAANIAVVRGLTADGLTITGCVAGLGGAGLIAAGLPLAGLVLFLVGRCLDGLDGTVARATRPTRRGGFLDIVLDFVVYAAVPLAFAWADPGRNALAACALLAGFLVNGAAFLAFALLDRPEPAVSADAGGKAFRYLAGLAEGGETILAFTLFCLWPAAFATLATAFAGLCLVSAGARVVLGWRLLGDEQR